MRHVSLHDTVDTFAYARAHSNTRAHATVQQKRGCLALEDSLFFSLYSFSCIANNSTTLENILDSCLCPCFSIRTSSSALQHPHHLRPTPPVTLERVYLYTHLIADVLSTLPDPLPWFVLVLLGRNWQLHFDLRIQQLRTRTLGCAFIPWTVVGIVVNFAPPLVGYI